MPKISVIVPVYKVEPYLERCVDSILGQTFTDFELILVDDGSPDGCPAMCDAYAENDSRVTVIHKENGGLSSARNAGMDWVFEHSIGEWLAFIDSDDWVHDRYLEILINGAESTGMDIIVGDYEDTAGELPKIDEKQLEPMIWNTRDYYIKELDVNFIVIWGKLYKSALLKNIRYPEGKIHEDEFITYKVLFEREQIAVIQQPLYGYFINENSITGSEWNVSRLDVLDALDERTKYFYEKRDMELGEKTGLSVLDQAIKHISLSDTGDDIQRKINKSSTLATYKKYYKKYKSLTKGRRIYYYLNQYFVVNKCSVMMRRVVL